MKHRRDKAGVLYEAKVLRFFTLVVVMCLGFQFGSAENTDAELPSPAPTDAVEVSGQRLRFEGRASLDQGDGSARYAALLDAYSVLLKHGLSQGLFGSPWSRSEQDFRFYRIDSEHPAPEIVSWLTQAKVAEEKSDKKEKLLVLESLELGALASSQPALRAMVTQDVDSDGVSDMVAVGYDGSLYVFQTPQPGESKLTARSPSYAIVEMVSGPEFERVRTVVPQGIGSVEALGNGQARVLLEIELLEMVNGKLLGRAVEKREILITLDNRLDRIRFSLSEPPDFAKLLGTKAELRGTVISEQTLEDVSVRHNNELAWEVPKGVGIRALNFDVARSLAPGWNNFKIFAQDTEGYTSEREVWVEGPEPTFFSANRTKRAIVVSTETKWKAQGFSAALGRAGFSAQNVTYLVGNEATPQAVLDSIRKANGASDLLLYIESESVPGAAFGGKSLLLNGGVLTPTDIAQSIEAGRYQKSLAFFQSELARDVRQKFSSWDLWRDTADFAERLGSQGRLVFANIEEPEQSARKAQQNSRELLLEALNQTSGSDLKRLTNPTSAQRSVFRGWMFGEPILAR